MGTSKLTFAYLYYTVGEPTGYIPVLLGIFSSSKIAKTHMDLVNGDYIPIGRSNRVLQKVNKGTGQIWYVEKHVMKDAAYRSILGDI